MRASLYAGRLLLAHILLLPTFMHKLTPGLHAQQVFYAPHIASISSTFGVTFDTIQYVLDGDKLSSNVRYSHPLLGTGWLSASGKVQWLVSGYRRLSKAKR